MQIQRTTDYGQFQRLAGNRGIAKSHLERLQASIATDTKSTEYSPVIVNENMEIIDGQHRFEALQDLGLPVYYIQVPGLRLEHVQRLNSISKNWTPTDFAKSYSELGHKEYDQYLEFRRKFRLTHEVTLRFLAIDSHTTTEMFRSGNLRITDYKESVKMAEQMGRIGEFYPYYRLRNFGFAFYRILRNPEYDQDRMIRQLIKKPIGEKILGTVEDNLRAIEKIYNHGVRDEESVRLF